MSSHKSVSVIFCCYNKKLALIKSLENTMGQLDFERGDEIIVSDGKSTDGVEQALARFMPPLQFVQVEKRTKWNLNSVRNLGIKSASNDIIIIYDADCIPQPGCVDTFRANAERGIYLSGVIGYEVPYKIQEKLAKKHDGRALNMVFFKNYPVQEVIDRIEQDSDDVRGTIGGCMCFHKQDAIDVGLFDEDFNGCWGYGETAFILALHYNGVKIVNLATRSEAAIVMHQTHKFNEKWQDKCLKKNRALLRSKLPAYRRKDFDV